MTFEIKDNTHDKVNVSDTSRCQPKWKLWYAWQSGKQYFRGDCVYNRQPNAQPGTLQDRNFWYCSAEHISGDDNRPAEGIHWQDFWGLIVGRDCVSKFVGVIVDDDLT